MLVQHSENVINIEIESPTSINRHQRFVTIITVTIFETEGLDQINLVKKY